MEFHFAQSARKHRIGRQRALEVIRSQTPQLFVVEDQESERMLWVGTDQRGLELEIVGVKTPQGILIIHVMPMIFRRKGDRK
jgi:hypothetical protein